MTDTTATTTAFLDVWRAAEQAGDRRRLDDLLTDDFRGVGPVGFVLPKAAWLGRFEGGLHYQRVELSDIDVRHVGTTDIAVALQHVVGDHAGTPLPPTTRVTLVVAEANSHPRLAHFQAAFMAGTPGAPGPHA